MPQSKKAKAVSENNKPQQTDTKTDDCSKESADISTDKKAAVRKVYGKPRPQIIENMKEYVDNNTLDRLTTVTLQHWLKGQSIHCTTRDKKENLMEKVRKHFLETSN